MSFRDTGNEALDSFNEPENGVPEAWERESPAESQDLRWERRESDDVLWVESETDSGSPYAIFITESSSKVADVFSQGFESLEEAEVEAVKIMEDFEELNL